MVFASEEKDDVIEMTPNMEIPHIYAFCPFSNAWKYSFNELVTLAWLNANSF